MTEFRDTNRAMFWRIIRRLLSANRGRLFVMLLALGAGAAVTAALLNLQVDAKRRLTTEFRAFGANVVVLPKGASESSSGTLPESVISEVHVNLPGGHVTMSSSLYLIASVSVPQAQKTLSAVVEGSNPLTFAELSFSSPTGSSGKPTSASQALCLAGPKFAEQASVRPDTEIVLTSGDNRESCLVAGILASTGGPEDNRIVTGLQTAQRLAGLPGRVSTIELRVPGTPSEIQSYISNLQSRLTDADVHPVRQFTEGEAKIYSRISGLLTATVGIVLLLTALCVMAAMTNVAIERKMDVGLMKAIGGATRRVVRLFLAEAALLGLAGGLIGAALGILLSIGLGKAVFGVAARPRLIVYPVAVGLTMLVAILSAFPLRRLASIRPASVFRGEA